MCQCEFAGCKHHKVGGFIDATGAMGIWKDFGLPKEMLNCISAKIIRYYGYQERIAGTQHWDYLLQWASGLHISLVHLISHMLDQIIDVQQESKWRARLTPTVSVVVGAPITIKSNHAKQKAIDLHPNSPPTGRAATIVCPVALRGMQVTPL